MFNLWPLKDGRMMKMTWFDDLWEEKVEVAYEELAWSVLAGPMLAETNSTVFVHYDV